MGANMPQSGNKIIATDNSILRDTLAAGLAQVQGAR